MTLFDGTTGRQVWFDVSAGTIGTESGATGQITSFGNGWWRCSITATGLAFAFSQANIALATADNILAYTGDGTSGLFLWGAQVEAGSFPTSYIPTVASSVVRSADLCSITGASFTGLYNQSEGTLFSQSTKTSTNANAFIVYASGGSFANTLDLRYGSVTLINAVMNVASATQITGLQATVTSGSSPKQAFAYKLNDCAYSANGAAAITDTSALIPTVSQLNIGLSHNSIQQPLNGHIATLRYYKKRLSDAKLQSITA